MIVWKVYLQLMKDLHKQDISWIEVQFLNINKQIFTHKKYSHKTSVFIFFFCPLQKFLSMTLKISGPRLKINRNELSLNVNEYDKKPWNMEHQLCDIILINILCLQLNMFWLLVYLLIRNEIVCCASASFSGHSVLRVLWSSWKCYTKVFQKNWEIW